MIEKDNRRTEWTQMETINKRRIIKRDGIEKTGV